MYFWDYEVKNKIKSFTFLDQPVSCTKISDDGLFLAYCLGYDWHKGVESANSYNKPKIVVHYIRDNELKAQK